MLGYSKRYCRFMKGYFRDSTASMEPLGSVFFFFKEHKYKQEREDSVEMLWGKADCRAAHVHELKSSLLPMFWKLKTILTWITALLTIYK